MTHVAELGDYRQEVTVTKVGGTVYLDEGNAFHGSERSPE